MIISAYCNYLFDTYKNSDELSAYEKKIFTLESAQEEAVANFVATKLFGGIKTEEGYNSLMALKNENKGIIQTFIDFIKHLKNKIFGDKRTKTLEEDLYYIEHRLQQVLLSKEKATTEAVAEKHYVDNKGKRDIDTKRKSRYNEFESIAMQWANSSDVEQGELKRLYSGKTSEWCLVIADKSVDGGYSILVTGTYERVKNFEQIYREENPSISGNIEILESTDGGSGGYSLFDGNRGNADRSIQQLEKRELPTNAEGSNENLRTGNIEASTEAGSVESAFSNAEIDTDSNKNYIPADKFGQAIKDFTEGKITEEEFYETATKIDESRAKYLNTKYKNKYRTKRKGFKPYGGSIADLERIGKKLKQSVGSNYDSELLTNELGALMSMAERTNVDFETLSRASRHLAENIVENKKPILSEESREILGVIKNLPFSLNEGQIAEIENLYGSVGSKYDS